MKTKALYLIFMTCCLPASVWAHPGDHHEHNLVTILGHFFSEPDHVLVLLAVIALLWGAADLRRLFLVRIRSAFARKKNKHAP